MRRNGLQVRPRQEATFLQRLTKRPVKENAIIEITNLLATKDIRAVSMPQVADILKSHDLGFSEVASQVASIFGHVVLDVAKDRKISGEERVDLEHLRMIFRLADGVPQKAHEDTLADVYAESLANALTDGTER